MSEILFLDFETRSAADLPKCGADVYARHPTTKVMAVGYAFDDEPAQLLKIDGYPPDELCAHIEDGLPVVAHNASFEWLIWNFAWRNEWPGLPELKIEQLFCTMAQAYSMALPGSLEKAAAATGITTQKDMKGQRTMLTLSKPKDDFGNFHDPNDVPERFQEMYEYCLTDVNVERELYKRLMPLSKKEQDVWRLDFKINQRGVALDIKSVEKTVKLVEAEKNRLDGLIRSLTGNAVATCTSTAQLVAWLKDNGVNCDSVAKNDVSVLLSKTDLSHKCREALMVRQEAAKSSNAKLISMLKGVCDDGRTRGLFQYHGAGTGRWAGRRLQLQNFPRSKISQTSIEEIFGILGTINDDDYP